MDYVVRNTEYIEGFGHIEAGVATNQVIIDRKESSTEVTIYGEDAYIEMMVAEYFRDYHPDGYGTYVKTREPGLVIIWRANSCE